MRVVFAGTPAFAQAALAALIGAGHEIALVLTQPDRPAGRGLQPRPSEVKVLAQAHGIPLAQPVTLRDDVAIAQLAAVDARVMVVAAYGLILPQRVLDLFPLGCVNIHASLLPRWRGAAPIQRAILAGDARSGVSIMRMEAGLDTGPVYLERPLAIEPRDTAGTLHDKLASLGAQCIVDALVGLTEGRLVAHPQSNEGVTYAHKITKEEAEIDWRRSAVTLDRMVRAFNPFPVAATRLAGQPVRVWQAAPVANAAEPPGRVLRADSDGIVVACGEGALRIEALQRAGGRRLTAAEFLRGVPVTAGDRLG